MKLSRKRTGRTLPAPLGQGELTELGFDGYTLTAHAFDGAGCELRVSFDRHELTRLLAYATAQLEIQRLALAALRRTTDALYGGAD